MVSQKVDRNILILLSAVFLVPAYDHLIRAEAVRVRPNYALRGERKGGQIKTKKDLKEMIFFADAHFT